MAHPGFGKGKAAIRGLRLFNYKIFTRKTTDFYKTNTHFSVVFLSRKDTRVPLLAVLLQLYVIALASLFVG